MPAPQTEVLITIDGKEHARHVLTPGDYVIGRNSDCHLRVDADLVSRQHAKLILNYDHALIEDLGSSNGTFVNDAPVTGRTRLWPSQKIRIGAATVTLRRLQGEAPSDLSIAPAQRAVRDMLPAEMLREKKYDIGAVVARGGMGAILDAREAAIKRKVAMKVMLDTNDADAIARFVAEAQVTGQLEHPNIVPVYELGVDENGQPFYTMKMVRGITLKKVLELLADGTEATVKKYPLPALLTVFQKVCDALAFAHSKGVIHRDLKPENIMIGDFGSVLVMDWGLAKVFDPTRAAASVGPGQELRSLVHTPGSDGHTGSMTLAGTIMGTPQFMSPEQARGEVETLDARSDIYSLGAILYQILSLRVPVTGADAWDIVGKVGRGEIEPLECGGKRSATPLWQERSDAAGAPGPDAQSRPGAPRPAKAASLPPHSKIPDSLAAVVRKAMALDPAARYRSVADLQHDIESYQTGFATSAENAGFGKQLLLAFRRHKAVATSIAAALAVLAAVVTVAFIRINGEKNRATRALADLRKTAPTFHAQALALIKDGKLDAALGKIGTAIDLDPSADYLALKGGILQSLFRFQDAAAVFDDALARDPGHALAHENAALSRQLAKQLGPEGKLPKPSQETLLAALEKQGRKDEALLLANALGRTANLLRDEIVQRLQRALKLPDSERPALAKRIATDDKGGLSVDLSKLPISDLSVLQGLPIAKLDLSATQIGSLQPLTGMPLTWLSVAQTKVTTLQPLREMKLRSLDAKETKITDLSPLVGMPLQNLEIQYTRVVDLTPLHGSPLKRITCDSSPVSDLTPLKGMPLRDLNASLSRVSDLSPLAGLPLKWAMFDQCRGVSDLSPLRGIEIEELGLAETAVADLSPLEGMPLRSLSLAGCLNLKDVRSLERLPQLESADLPLHLTDFEFLRRNPKLRSVRWIPKPAFSNVALPVPVARFWKHYDEFKAAEKKFAAAFAEQGATFTPGMHLTSTRGEYFEADLSGTPLRDLRFLEGLPVAVLKIANTGIRDLTPVAKCPLAEVHAASSQLEDLTPLATARLIDLNLEKTKVSDITPILGMPLVRLLLGGSAVKDVSPLRAIVSLVSLGLPDGATGVETLRSHPKILNMGFGSSLRGVADFWKQYDAKQAAQKK